MISVILTTYNVEYYIEKCIDSLINQTIKYELIIIDDGSTDNTLKIIKERYPSLKVVELLHCGVARARNKGIELATGKYITFLDSDDYFENNMLEELYNSIIKNDCDMSISSSYKFDSNTNEEVITHYMLNESIVGNSKYIIPNDFKSNLFQITMANAWAKMFRLSFIKENNILFQDLKNSNDVLFTFSSMLKANKIGIVRLPLVHYRFCNKNSLQGNKKQYPYEFIYAYKELKSFMINNNIYEQYKYSFNIMYENILNWNIKNLNDLERKNIINKSNQIMRGN